MGRALPLLDPEAVITVDGRQPEGLAAIKKRARAIGAYG